MNRPAINARSLKARAAAFAVSYLLLLAPLAAPSAHAASMQKKAKKPAPARIEVTLKDPAAVLRPNMGVTFVAKVFARNGDLIEDGEVRWSATGSDAVGLTPAVNEGARHEVTLIGFKPGGRTPAAAIVEVTATLGTLKDSESVSFQPNVTIALKPASGAPARFGPGEKYTIVASVNDGTTDIPNAQVEWSLADDSKGSFVELVIDRGKPNEINAIGLKPKDNAKSGDILVAATYGGISKFISIPYGDGATAGGGEPDNTARVADITVTRTGTPAPTPSPTGSTAQPVEYDIEPGQRLSLTATLTPEKGDEGKKKPKVVWSIPREMEKYIAVLRQNSDDDGKSEAVFFGLTPEAGQADGVREALYVLVQAKNFTKAVTIRNGEPSVDVSWTILPRDIVAKNYGRSISDKYYAIEVVIGNNSGNDLQLSGMSFKLNPAVLKGGAGDNMSAWASVVSYDAVRGMNEQKRLAFNRSTIIGGLDAAAQILTGFTPFFHVASRARNFSQGINILGNPVTKGIERVWPDPQQDEMDRLERQALHDNKIIPNNSVERTTVFVPIATLINCVNGTPSEQPKASNQQRGECLNKDDLVEIRHRLGQLILAGSKLNRNDFHLRVRPGGFRPPASSAATN